MSAITDEVDTRPRVVDAELADGTRIPLEELKDNERVQELVRKMEVGEFEGVRSPFIDASFVDASSGSEKAEEGGGESAL